jgi:hypothetical protein
VLAFTAAGWALYEARPWWRFPAIAGAILGLAASVLWWAAAASLPGVQNASSNVGLHAAAAALVLAGLLLPRYRRVVDWLLGERTSRGQAAR